MSFQVEFIPEPLLMFGNGEKSQDPRIGLIKHGPRTPNEEIKEISMKIGIIGSSLAIGEIQSIFKLMRKERTLLIHLGVDNGAIGFALEASFPHPLIFEVGFLVSTSSLSTQVFYPSSSLPQTVLQKPRQCYHRFPF